jgi:hypothetical protein
MIASAGDNCRDNPLYSNISKDLSHLSLWWSLFNRKWREASSSETFSTCNILYTCRVQLSCGLHPIFTIVNGYFRWFSIVYIRYIIVYKSLLWYNEYRYSTADITKLSLSDVMYWKLIKTKYCVIYVAHRL